MSHTTSITRVLFAAILGGACEVFAFQFYTPPPGAEEITPISWNNASAETQPLTKAAYMGHLKTADRACQIAAFAHPGSGDWSKGPSDTIAYMPQTREAPIAWTNVSMTGVSSIYTPIKTMLNAVTGSRTCGEFKFYPPCKGTCYLDGPTEIAQLEGNVVFNFNATEWKNFFHLDGEVDDESTPATMYDDVSVIDNIYYWSATWSGRDTFASGELAAAKSIDTTNAVIHLSPKIFAKVVNEANAIPFSKSGMFFSVTNETRTLTDKYGLSKESMASLTLPLFGTSFGDTKLCDVPNTNHTEGTELASGSLSSTYQCYYESNGYESRITFYVKGKLTDAGGYTHEVGGWSEWEPYKSGYYGEDYGTYYVSFLTVTGTSTTVMEYLTPVAECSNGIGYDIRESMTGYHTHVLNATNDDPLFKSNFVASADSIVLVNVTGGSADYQTVVISTGEGYGVDGALDDLASDIGAKFSAPPSTGPPTNMPVTVTMPSRSDLKLDPSTTAVRTSRSRFMFVKSSTGIGTDIPGIWIEPDPPPPGQWPPPEPVQPGTGGNYPPSPGNIGWEATSDTVDYGAWTDFIYYADIRMDDPPMGSTASSTASQVGTIGMVIITE